MIRRANENDIDRILKYMNTSMMQKKPVKRLLAGTEMYIRLIRLF